MPANRTRKKLIAMAPLTRSQSLRGWTLAPLALATVAVLSACSSSSSAAPAAPAAQTSAQSPVASPDVMSAPATLPAGSPSPASSPSAAAAVVITIKDFKYVSPASVAPGAIVTVMNQDAQGHTVTGDTAGQFDVKVDPNGTATFAAPTKPGTYAFHCIYHGNMHGSLVVK